MKSYKLLSGMACALLGLTAPAHAANFSFTGNLSTDDEVQLFSFTVGALSTVTLHTLSYAGGVNAAGTAIARGGFDPILALFDSTGALINQNDDGVFPLVPFDGVANVSGSGEAWDTYLQASLAAGTYTVAVSQFANFALGPNLANGFAGSGVVGFTDVSGTTFSDRDSHWAFDVLNVEQATTVPEGGSGLILLSIGMGACLASSARRIYRRRRPMFR